MESESRIESRRRKALSDARSEGEKPGRSKEGRVISPMVRFHCCNLVGISLVWGSVGDQMDSPYMVVLRYLYATTRTWNSASRGVGIVIDYNIEDVWVIFGRDSSGPSYGKPDINIRLPAFCGISGSAYIYYLSCLHDPFPNSLPFSVRNLANHATTFTSVSIFPHSYRRRWNLRPSFRSIPLKIFNPIYNLRT